MKHYLLNEEIKIHTRSSQRQQQGSTLLEVIVAIFVLSLGVLALMLAQLGAVNTSINAANQAAVTRTVQNYIEEMRAQPKFAAKGEIKGANSIAYLIYNYDQFNSTDIDDCVTKLKLHLTNTPTINQCQIVNGTVTVQWRGQKNGSDDDNDNDFSYSLSVNNNRP